jgi:hypothetical protein
MSINVRPPTKSNALKFTVPLDGAGTYSLWSKQVQAYVIRTLKISDFNQITCQCYSMSIDAIAILCS